MDKAKSKAELLIEMATILYEVDPMGLHSPHDDEYESEALSILARFNEAGFQLADAEEATPIAVQMVSDVFQFWFDEMSRGSAGIDWEPVSRRLLIAYLESYPRKGSVEHVTIG
jgi:hypothetical protein